MDIENPMDLYRKLPDSFNPQAYEITKIRFLNSDVHELPMQLFRLFPNLTELDASGTYLSRIERQDTALNRVRKFNASYNKIHRLSNGMSSNFERLENLDLSYNQIERIMPEAFKFSSYMRFLNLSNNKIPSLDRIFFDAVRTCEILKLNDNSITEITGSFKHFLPIWKELYLQNNKILSVEPEFVKIPTYLDLSFNQIESLDLAEAKTLELKIVANRLKNLTIGRRLKKLNASENRFYLFRINSEINRNNLTHLYLSFVKNKIDGEKLLIDFTRFDKLEVLDLSQNNIITFDIRDLTNSRLYTLHTLNLRDAHIRFLKNYDAIGDILPNLKVIDIFDNMFRCSEINPMINKFLALNLTIPDYGENTTDFISRSCSSYEPSYIPSYSDETSTSNFMTIVWVILIMFSIGSLVIAIFIANKRLMIFEKIYDNVKLNPSYKVRGQTKLLDEEKVHEVENY